MEIMDFYRDIVLHCGRVSGLVRKVCEELGKDASVTSFIEEAALLHDVGKFYVKKNILCVNRGLSSLEKSIVDMHALYGYNVGMSLGYNIEVCQLILVHHGVDKWFIEKEKLLPVVKDNYSVLKACDIWDALTSDRVYRGALSVEQAVKILSLEQDIPKEICNAIYKISDMC